MKDGVNKTHRGYDWCRGYSRFCGYSYHSSSWFVMVVIGAIVVIVVMVCHGGYDRYSGYRYLSCYSTY